MTKRRRTSAGHRAIKSPMSAYTWYGDNSTIEDPSYYEAHKDDPDVWGEPEQAPAAAPKRRLASMISVRFSPDEAAHVRQAAQAANESLSQFVRRAALQQSGLRAMELITAECPTYRGRTSLCELTMTGIGLTQAHMIIRGSK
jgi:hypothetical protein